MTASEPVGVAVSVGELLLAFESLVVGVLFVEVSVATGSFRSIHKVAPATTITRMTIAIIAFLFIA